MAMLPELPQKKNKREANWTTKTFRKWLKDNPMLSAPIEIKYTTKDNIPFKAVAPHQIDSLLACKSDKGFLWKIPDLGATNPFDCFYYRNSPAYICIKYPKGHVMIDVETFVMESKRSKRKSLTWSRAKEISIFEKV